MRFWNYIGEFLLFRWMLGKFRKSATTHDAHTEDLGTLIDRDGKHMFENHDENIVQNDCAATSVEDDLIDDSGNSEELDDLDRFMRNNSGKNSSSLYHGGSDSDCLSRSHYSSHNDWDSGSYSQLYDDFHDEQDDYDMMDDDF